MANPANQSISVQTDNTTTQGGNTSKALTVSRMNGPSPFAMPAGTGPAVMAPEQLTSLHLSPTQAERLELTRDQIRSLGSSPKEIKRSGLSPEQLQSLNLSPKQTDYLTDLVHYSTSRNAWLQALGQESVQAPEKINHPFMKRQVRELDFIAATRLDPAGVVDGAYTQQQLGLIHAVLAEKQNILDGLNLPDKVRRVLQRDLDTEKLFLNSFQGKPGARVHALNIGGRLGLSLSQMTPAIVMMKRKGLVLFIPHHSKSAVINGGQLRRQTAQMPAVLMQDAKRDTFLWMQSALFAFSLIPTELAQTVTNHTGYRVAVIAISVAAAVMAIHPRDTARFFRGDSRKLKNVPMNGQTLAGLQNFRQHAKLSSALVRDMRDRFPDEPSDTTDWVASGVETEANTQVADSTKLLDGEPTLMEKLATMARFMSPSNYKAIFTALVAFGVRGLASAATVFVAASPLFYIDPKKDFLAFAGTLGNTALAAWVAFHNLINPAVKFSAMVNDFRRFCAFTLFITPTFAVDQQYMHSAIENTNAGTYGNAAWLTLIGNTIPGLCLISLVNALSLAGFYMSKGATAASNKYSQWKHPQPSVLPTHSAPALTSSTTAALPAPPAAAMVHDDSMNITTGETIIGQDPLQSAKDTKIGGEDMSNSQVIGETYVLGTSQA